MGKINWLFRRRPGFTLVEIVVVAGIMALFSLTLISVFLATIRGGTKSQAVQLVHQEGDFVIKQMTKIIREADSVLCNGNEAYITLTNGNMITYSLAEDEGVSRVASDSGHFLSGRSAEATDLSFECAAGLLGNQVVTIRLELSLNPTGQVQEKSVQSFATSVSTRQL